MVLRVVGTGFGAERGWAAQVEDDGLNTDYRCFCGSDGVGGDGGDCEDLRFGECRAGES